MSRGGLRGQRRTDQSCNTYQVLHVVCTAERQVDDVAADVGRVANGLRHRTDSRTAIVVEDAEVVDLCSWRHACNMKEQS